MRRLLLALALMLLSTPAWAACTTLPFTLLPGVPPDGSQMMADLNALNDNCAQGGAASNGTVVMTPPLVGSGPTVPYQVSLPAGATPLSCGATNSQCLNEAMAYSAANSYALVVNGRSYIGTAEAQGKIEASVPVQVPACSFCSITITNVLLKITAANGMVFDSYEAGTFRFDTGVIFFVSTAGSAGSAVLFKPTNPQPTDGNIGINIANIILPPIAAPQVAVDSVVTFDLTNGPVSRADFQFIGDICGACNPVGFSSVATNIITVKNASLANAFSGNRIIADQLHQFTGNGVQIGTADDFLHAYSNNYWSINAIDPKGGQVGFKTFGSGDIIRIGLVTNDEGTFQNCFSFATANAYNNNIRAGCQGYSGAAAVDVPGGTGGPSNEIWLTNTHGGNEAILIGPGRPALLATSLSNQSVTSGVSTKANLTAAVDVNGFWNNSTHLWTPKASGSYQVCWGAQGSSASLMSNVVAVVGKNGAVNNLTPVAQASAVSGTLSGTANGCSILTLNGTSDTIELDVAVTATTPVIIGNGSPPVTYMTAARIGP